MTSFFSLIYESLVSFFIYSLDILSKKGKKKQEKERKRLLECRKPKMKVPPWLVEA